MSFCKYCFVRTCCTNSKKNPDKYFFRVPYNRETRRKWCVAVGRNPDTLSYASAAFCCSDHFNMVSDLNRIASSRTVPVLRSDVLPTLERQENQMQIVQADEVPDRPGDNEPKNLFVREVVYIEENYNDRFLEEANDMEDALNIEGDCNPDDSLAQDVIEILDDEKPVEPSSANKTSGTSLPKKIVLFNNKNKSPIHYAPLKDLPNKPLILRHIQQLNSVGKQNGVKFIPVSNVKPIPAKIQLNQKKTKALPETAISKNFVSQRTTDPALVSVRPINTTPKTHPVNKTKYLNVNETKKSTNEQNVNNSRTPSDDDDCIVVEEQNVLSNIKETVTASNTDPSVKLLKTLPSSISIKSVSGRGFFKIARAPKPAPKEILQRTNTETIPTTRKYPSDKTLIQPSSSNAIVPGPSPFSNKLNVNQDKVFSLIKLMISENHLLLGRHMGQLVKIARTKPNEFKIANTIYYYRTNDEFENNYFFMNITRQSRHANEIIQRCYSIYWGNPRRNCVGVVETKGSLDDDAKDFVFQQVKKSLFNNNDTEGIDPTQKIQPIPLVLHNVPSARRVSTNRQVSVKPIKVLAVNPMKVAAVLPIKVPAVTKPATQEGANTINLDHRNIAPRSSNSLQPRSIKKIVVQRPISKITATSTAIKIADVRSASSSNINATSIQDDDRNIVAQSSNSLQKRPIKKFVVQSPISKNTATSTDIKIVDVQSASSANTTATSKVSLDAFPTRPIIKKLSSSDKATVKTKTPPRAKPKKKPVKIDSQNDPKANNELIRLSHFLTPNIRRLINKLKYFELSNGKVFTVKVGDSISKDKPFNIVFTENKPQFLLDIKARPVSKDLYVSKLVNYLFEAIYPYMRNRRSEPIPIPPPQDIISDATPALMDALSISESKRTYKEIAKLEASVNNSHAAHITADFKHKCQICSQAFQRKYQLLRHKFVTHDSKPGEKSAESSPPPSSIILNTIPDSIRKAFQDLEGSCSSNLSLTTAIKTEKPDEIIENDQSLLVPLYEEPINEARYQVSDDISSVKEEPEEHFEEMTTLPLSMDHGHQGTSNRKAKKRKFENDDDSSDETDSAPECLESLTDGDDAELPTGIQGATFEEYAALEQQRQEKMKRIAKVKEAEINRKIIRSMRSKRIGKAKKASVMPIKISRAIKMIKKWPSLTVDLVDINRK